MSNVRAGDIAVIVCDPMFDGADIGRLVHVEHAVPIEDWGGGLPEWACTSLCGKLQAVQGWDKSYKFVDIPDAWLRPLRADGITHEDVADLFTPDELAFVTTGERVHG